LAHVAHGRVGDEQLAAGRALFGNATRGSAEIAINQVIFDKHRAPDNGAAAGDPDSDQPGVDAIEIEVAQTHGFLRVLHVEKIEGDDDAVGAAGEDRTEHLATIDGEGLGNGHSAKAARIEAIDLPIDGSLGHSAGEGLARRGAQAWIGIIAPSRHKRPQRLGLNGPRLRQHEHE